MTVTARFIRGNKTIDIVYPYSLSGFVPPSVRPDYNITTGTSANKTGGGELFGLKYNNRSISFGVRVLGTSRSQMETSVRKLQAFLAGATGEVTYFEYRDNTLPVPLYGQFGASLRYEIVTAETYYNNEYQSDMQRASGLTVGISLVVRPFAVGSRQRVATASGGVTEDILGMADGSSRGLMVMEATTNKMTNPVFGSTTWNTGWTAAANIVASQNTALDFVFPGGINSAYLTCKAATNDTFTQSINAGDTNAHYLTAYVVKPDRSAVTSSDVALYYGASKTTTYTAMGNGVYRLSAAVTGINAGTATGVIVSPGKSIYLMFTQLEEKAYFTPPCFGDQIGCAWTGTAHASTSSRTAGRVTLLATEVFNQSQGTIAWTVKMPMDSTLQPTSVFWDMAGVTFRSYWQLSDSKFYFNDGTNSISSVAKSFAAGDVLTFHATWGSSGLKLYLNGSEIATGATYTIPTIGATFDIGRDEIGFCGNATTMAWSAYSTALSAGQVLELYRAMDAVSSSDRRVDYIPWLWTKDGDNIVDNCDDSTRDNWAVVAGVPGTVDALTEFQLTYDATDSSVWIGKHLDRLDDWRKLTDRFYVDSGIAPEVGNSSGNYYSMASGLAPRPASSITPLAPRNINGEFHFFCRLRCEAATVSTGIGFYILTPNGYIYSTDKRVTVTTDYKLFYVGKLYMAPMDLVPPTDVAIALSMNFDFAAGTERLDFIQVINGPVFRVRPVTTEPPGGGGAVVLPTKLYIQGQRVSFNTSLTVPEATGDMIELTPGMYNTIQVIQADQSGLYDLADTLTFSAVYTTPRMELI